MRRYDSYKNIRRLFADLCVLMLLFNACGMDNVEVDRDKRPEEATLKFSVKLPISSSNSLRTYALDSDDEAYLQTVDILVFTEDDYGIMKFNYRVRARIVADEGSAPYIEARLWKTETNSQLVILANVGQQLDQYFFSNEETFVQMQSSLQYTCEGRWPARLDENPEAFVPLPMWAKLELGAPINEDIDLMDDEVFLLRGVARVEVAVDAAVNFSLQTVYVFNNNENGLIMPDTDKLTTEGAVSGASLPVPLATNNDPDSPLIYETNGANSAGEIYLFEADAAPEDPSRATALVIEGKFNGEDDPYFYRIDFKDVSGNLMPLLRNHWYRINIVKAEFTGATHYTTPQAAFAAASLSHPEASYVGSSGVISTRSPGDSSVESPGLLYTMTTFNEQD